MTTPTFSNSQPRDLSIDENNNPKSKECLQIKPSRELNFVHLKNRYVADLNLINKKDEPVLYKIRTTAAKSYIVLPTIGLLAPGEAASVKVYMPKTEFVKDRISDRFLVQAFVYNGKDIGDDTLVMNQVFDHNYKSLSSKEFQNTKLRVYFESHTVIEEEASEDVTPTPHHNNNPLLNASPKSVGLADSSAFRKSKSDNYPATSVSQQPNQILTPMSPEPDALSRKDDRIPYNDLAKILPEDNNFDTFRVSLNRSTDSYRNKTPEPYTYSANFKTPEQDILSQSYRAPENLNASMAQSYRGTENLNVSVARSLKDELEKEPAPVNNSLKNITNSVRREYNSYSSNDVSIHTEYSDIRSDVSMSEQLFAYRKRLEILERKYNEQKAQMDKIIQEKDKYQKEAQNLRRGSASLSTTADESKLGQNNKVPQMDIWHLLILCVVCMTLGSIFR